MDELPEVDTPLNLRPDLSIYGIPEIDRGICEDSQENRTILRQAKLGWLTVYNAEGRPSGHIEVISPEMVSARASASLDDKSAILTDTRNKNSDFVSGLALLLEHEAPSLVPPWVMGATKRYRALEMEGPTGLAKIEKLKLAGPPQRCRAIKSDGIRCQFWTGGRRADDGMCRTHLGSLLNRAGGAVEVARTRIQQAAPRAVETMERLMDAAESEAVQQRAAEQLLDRAGIRGGVEIDTTNHLDIKPAAQQILDRLQKLKEGADEALARANGTFDMIDGEVVEEPVPAAQNVADAIARAKAATRTRKLELTREGADEQLAEEIDE